MAIRPPRRDRIGRWALLRPPRRRRRSRDGTAARPLGPLRPARRACRLARSDHPDQHGRRPDVRSRRRGSGVGGAGARRRVDLGRAGGDDLARPGRRAQAKARVRALPARRRGVHGGGGLGAAPCLALFVALIAVGAAAGVLAGLLGVGGGILLVPFLVLAVGMTQHEAEATSLLVILPTAVAASIALRRRSVGDLPIALLIAVVGAFGAFAGALLALWLPADVLRAVFAVLLAIAGLRLIRDARMGQAGAPQLTVRPGRRSSTAWQERFRPASSA